MKQKSLTSREHPLEGIPSRPGVEGINQKLLTSREQPYEGTNEKLLTSRYAPEEDINHWKGATIGRKEPSTIDTKEATLAIDTKGSTVCRYDVPMPSTRVRRPEAGMVSTTGNHASTVEWKASLLCHRYQGSNPLPSTPRHQPMVGGRMQDVIGVDPKESTLCRRLQGVNPKQGWCQPQASTRGRGVEGINP